MPYFKCKICGHITDDGDPLNMICLDCIDNGKFRNFCFICGYCSSYGCPTYGDEGEFTIECKDCRYYLDCNSCYLFYDNTCHKKEFYLYMKEKQQGT